MELYSFRIKSWKTEVKGIILEESPDWILIKSLFTDFMIDGFKVINKKHIITRSRTDDIIFTEKVLKATNKWNFTLDHNIPLTKTSIFEWLYKNKIIFQIILKDDTISFVGKIDRISPKSFYLCPLNTDARWESYTLLFRLDSVRVIDLDTDYIKSLVTYEALNK